MRERISEAYRRDGLWFLTSAPGFALQQADVPLNILYKKILNSKKIILSEDSTHNYTDIREFKYGCREQVTVSTEHCLTPPPERIYQFTGKYTLPKPRIFEVRNAQIIGYPNIISFTKDGIPLVSSKEINFWFELNISDLFQHKNTLSIILSLQMSGLQFIQETNEYDTVVPLVDQSCTTYGHWINMYLPMLKTVEKYEKETGECVNILIHPSSPKWMRDSIKLLGFDDKDIISWEPGKAIVNRLLIPSPRFKYGRGYSPTNDSEKMLGVYSKNAHKWMQQRIISNLSTQDAPEFSDNIYISRKNTNRRRVVNEQEVMTLLSEYEYESYAPETLSFENQVRLFAQAQNVIGPHGSALVGTVFSTDHTLLELYSDGIGFDPIMNSRNGQYSSLECGTVPNEGDENDISVELDALESHINEHNIY